MRAMIARAGRPGLTVGVVEPSVGGVSSERSVAVSAAC